MFFCFLLLCILSRYHFSGVPLRETTEEVLLVFLSQPQPSPVRVSFFPFSSFSSWISHISVSVCDRLCIMVFNWSLWGRFRAVLGVKNNALWFLLLSNTQPTCRYSTYLCFRTEPLNNSAKMANSDTTFVVKILWLLKVGLAAVGVRCFTHLTWFLLIFFTAIFLNEQLSGFSSVSY